MDTTFGTKGLAQTTGLTWRVFNFFRKCWGAFQEWRTRERVRADLNGLNDRELQDIGIARGEIDYTVSNRSTDPRNVRPARLCRSVVAHMIILSAVTFLGIGMAYPHDPKRPELGAWFKSLKNKAGEPCCDDGDGEHAQAEWDMKKGGYRVLLKNRQKPDEPGKWFDVPYSVLIDQPNISGVAMVWWWPSYDVDGGMTPMWRCFIPGAGG